MQFTVPEQCNRVINVPDDLQKWCVQDYEANADQIEADSKSNDITTRRIAKLVKLLAGVN